LPYLEIAKTKEDMPKTSVAMPEVTGVSADEAKKALKEAGLEYEIQGNSDGNAIIIDQLPEKGIMINSGTKVILKTQ